jgi:SAM-dependent methyltransferase
MREISGDIGPQNMLTRREQVWYLCYNCVRGVWGYRVWHKTTHFTPSTLMVPTSDSPGRQYIDLFLHEVLPQYVPKGTVSILDVGCGSGYIRTILANVGYTGTYTGVDVFRDRQYDSSAHSAFENTFHEAKIENFRTDRTFDLVVSNTALEHVEDDERAVAQCNTLAGKGVQVHIMPAFWSLFLYLWHGYRQYTPARLTRLFRGQSYTIYRIGGLGSFLLHFFYCTIPERLTGSDRLRRNARYPRLVRIAFRVDRYLPICGMFYAVIVYPHE